ncbi:MAG: hypothetical protein LQ342_007306 [Letrouitia transgressa]|nr:MAG: hypothetical protein LQ342_007306 [Letrouitia transgressa]
MAPKSLPPLAKQSLVLTYLQNSGTVHNIKELEKVLPLVASINGMQVKDYLQALQDDGKIRVEKIGSGNWYWSFLSEEKKSRENTLDKLREEKTMLDLSVEGLSEKVKEAAKDKPAEGDTTAVINLHDILEQEVKTLRLELESYKDADPEELQRKKEETTAQQRRAERWTDNIGIIEGWFGKLLGGDKEQMERIRQECYGSEYLEGEGLMEF